MITTEQPLIELLGLIDMVWVQTSSGSLKQYSQQSLFKVYVVSLLKQLWSRRSVWRYLTGTPLVAEACGLERVPDRRTLDRRLVEIAGQAETQIAALGWVLTVEGVTAGYVAASDGSAFKAHGPVWHKKTKQQGISPMD